ncbi:MAG: MarC family protein [Gemmatimonadetes bacterium]|nr:MarC family protein [Gemmatimonadota bacterium]
MTEIIYGTVTLFALTNPLAELPFFLGATRSAPDRRPSAAVKVSVGVMAVLAAAALFGAQLLQVLGISVNAFRAAGGLVVALVGLELLRGEGSGLTSVKKLPGDPEDHLWVPLVMPLLAGPGAITAAITLSLAELDRLGSALPVQTLIGVVFASLSVLILLLTAPALVRAVSRRGIRIFERFSGLVLLAAGFEMGLHGVRSYFAP